MPTYAILGTTGKTGGSILQLLLKAPNNKVNVYVRSKSKLHSQVPNLGDNKAVQVFEGALTDINVMASCLANVDVIFSAIGENENVPGSHMTQDAAQAIVAALCQDGFAESRKKVPKVILLSTMSLNPTLTAHEPKILQWVLARAFYNAYADVERAMDYLRLHKSWLNVTFIQPGALIEGEQKGHRLSMEDSGGGFVSYLDLAAGMIEVAQSDKYDGKGVSVAPTTDNKKFEWAAAGRIVRGLVWYFLPPLGWMGKSVGVF